MPYEIRGTCEDDEHRWALVHCKCEPGAGSEDVLVRRTVLALRRAYGEEHLTVRLQHLVERDPAVEETFALENVIAAFRSALPNPDAEQTKPEQLRTYRSEAAEVVAMGALEEVHGIKFPFAPQRFKLRALQPVLGFDGWGFLELAPGTWALVLMQAKAPTTTRSLQASSPYS